MIETLVVAMTGGVFGIAVAYWIAKAIRVLAPDDLPSLTEIGVSAPVALFTFAAVIDTTGTIVVWYWADEATEPANQ